MKSILQFMYLGQATFYQERMNEFLNVAKSLEIKEISKDVDRDVADSSHEQQVYEEAIEPNIEISQEESTILRLNNVKAETECASNSVNIQVNEADQYPCNKCDKQFTQKGTLVRHMRSAHEGIRYPCNDCAYKATTKQTLERHIQTIHLTTKFK